METTLEVRWFFPGMPPAIVQLWFRRECPGKLLETEIRTDLYASIGQKHLDLLAEFLSHPLSRDRFNLKSRQGNLELKLRQQDFSTYRFSNSKQSRICEGRVEQWSKLSDRELLDSVLLCNSPHEINWIEVNKEREQKIEQDVKSELTWLKSDRQAWWTVAFEMPQNKFDRQQDRRFQNVVEKACQTYSGPQLLAPNSFGYSQWLLEAVPQTMPQS